MGFLVIFGVIVVVIPIALIIRSYNYNHRIGEGLFKSSEYNLDESDDFVDKNYYDDSAFKKYMGKDEM